MKIDGSFAARLLGIAKAKGADHAEVYLKSSRNMTAESKGMEMDAVESSTDFGYSLRVIRDNRLGFAYSTDAAMIEAVADSAVEASRWSERDDYLCLACSSETSDAEIFDEAIALLGAGEAMERALMIEKAALDSDRRITKIRKASANFTVKDVIIVNSDGVDNKYSATSCTGQIMLAAEDGKDSQMGWDFNGSRFLKDISFEDIGRNAAKRAIHLLGSQKIKSMKAQILLDSSVATEFLGVFASLLSSENVQKGKSLLANRLNQKIVSPLINIVDDGTMPHKLGSKPFDDEGVATSKKYLVKDGVLDGYMYNLYTAKKGGAASTGNAVKAGFSSLPSVGPSNVYISSPKVIGEQQIIGMIDRGVNIVDVMGLHTANPVSGEFSVGISGLWIENGAVRHPVREAVISGNLLDFFGRIEAVGDDLTFYGNAGSPSLLFGLTDISG